MAAEVSDWISLTALVTSFVAYLEAKRLIELAKLLRL